MHRSARRGSRTRARQALWRPGRRGRGGRRETRPSWRLRRRGADERGGSLTRRRRPRRFEPARALARSKPDPALALVDELEEVLDLRERLELGASTLHRLRHVELRAEEQAVRALQLAHDLVGKAASLEPHAIEPVELHRVADRLDERRHVLRDARAAANEAVTTDLHELMHRGQPGEDRAVLHRHVTRQLRGVRDDHAVSDVAVVREVHVRHQEAPLPDGRLERLGGAAIDRRVLADTGAVADLDPRLLALELQVLGVSAKHRADPYDDVRAEPNVLFQHGTGLDRAPIADHAAVADDGVRADGHVVPELRPRRHDRGRMDSGHHSGRLAHRSRTMAAITASATTSPSTFATPFILQIRPRICTTSSSNRSWSPGLTGRRHFTLSSDMK